MKLLSGSMLVFAFVLLGASMTGVADEAEVSGEAESKSGMFDAEDGWFDVSNYLDTAYGFVPVLAPITEPAVGYGAAGALVFIDRNTPRKGQSHARPNIAVLGGLATQNDTKGVFAAHLGNWMDGRFRTLAGWADADINLEFFGLGGNLNPGGRPVNYSIHARGGIIGASYQLGESPFWVGLRYASVSTSIGLNRASIIPVRDLNLNLAAITPSLTYDTRDNFFTPTRGWYLDVSAPMFSKSLGSDRDFQKLALTAMHYRPVTTDLFFSARATARTSSGETPFFLRPFVQLRGVQALRYQGEQAAEVEAEMRWQLHPRFSLVGFGGAGIARGDGLRKGTENRVTSGGAGFRYLLARKYGLHMGLDLAVGPDEPILYVVFGSAWLRP